MLHQQQFCDQPGRDLVQAEIWCRAPAFQAESHQASAFQAWVIGYKQGNICIMDGSLFFLCCKAPISNEHMGFDFDKEISIQV